MLEIKVDASGLDEIHKAVLRALDWTGFMSGAIPLVSQAIARNFDAQGRPRWVGYDPDTDEQGGKMLQGSGMLRARAMSVLFSKAGESNYQFGSDVGQVGMVHNFGFNGIVARRTPKGKSSSFYMAIPKREFFVMPPGDVNGFVDALRLWIGQRIGS